MEKAVLISIKPKWCIEIASGRKTLEIRKSVPKDLYGRPFRCFIYCTKDDRKYFMHDEEGKLIEANGMVIGEFICDDIGIITPLTSAIPGHLEERIDGSCLAPQQVEDYAGWRPDARLADCKNLYYWHISNLKMYSAPRELQSFTALQKTRFGLREVKMTKAPQSWCYVEENGGHI